MVLDTCANHEYSALDAVVPRFNNGGLSKPSKGTGSQFAWDVTAGTSVTSGGGEYRICWCANGFDCALSKHFHVDAGTLTVIGPSPQYQDRTCVTGQVCWMNKLYGQDLGDGDRILVLDTCGLFTVPPRFVNKGMSDDLTVHGSNAHWGGYKDCDEPWNFDCRGVRPTAQGADYRLCWCGHNYTCDKPYDFRVDMGMLMMVGPNPLQQKRTCVAGQTCLFQGITGHFLQDGDRFMVLDTCGRVERRQLFLRSNREGVTTYVLRNKPQYGFFDGYSHKAKKNGTAFAWGNHPVYPNKVITAAGGLYRLCWCGTGYNCEIPEDFQADAGVQNVITIFAFARSYEP